MGGQMSFALSIKPLASLLNNNFKQLLYIEQTFFNFADFLRKLHTAAPFTTKRK